MAKIIRQVPAGKAAPEPQPETPPAPARPTAPHEPARAVAQWLLRIAAEEVWKNLKENAALPTPYGPEAMETEEWLAEILKTLFPYEHIQQLQAGIAAEKVGFDRERAALEEKANSLLREKDDLSLRLRRLQDAFAQQEAGLIRLQRLQRASIDLAEILPYWFGGPDDESGALRQVLGEELQDADEQLLPFVTNLARGWTALRSLLQTLPEDEDLRLSLLYPCLTELLTRIAGLAIPQRRAVLDIVARACTRQSGKYIFISPEESTRVDPAIHQAVGLGSDTVKEGKTFAVIRRDTRQTVRFAEIEVG